MKNTLLNLIITLKKNISKENFNLLYILLNQIYIDSISESIVFKIIANEQYKLI